MILDIIVIGLVLLFVVIGVLKGAARMIVGLLMSFLAFLAASWLGKWIAGVIYQNHFAPAVNKAVADASGSAGSVIKDLPWWATRSLDISGKEITDSSTGIAGTVNAVIEPIVSGVISILLTLVLFLVINFILHKLVMKPILAIFKLPVINTVNKILGGVIGAAEGILFVCMLAYILKLVLPYIDTDIGFLNESTIYNSFIFYHFYSGNIFTILTSWL